ncbi:Hypothetical protein R9X50_00028600 [Acrodontium crateriforme]|uniref:1-phosphatidylinositol-3-phosphate 5-kinase n=1 Tax=Acrodontium crateriforme TaxID=150365 RepID=A0AAQ3R6Z5_9PEZI|nr:Hypothetical protein R9X50_00028600 [Acrodontium crateriforme]
MAPEPPSPSASSVLLPLIGGRARRGSLASINSRNGEVDKHVLAQVLDEIHTSASKSDTLTSFHEYDGGAPRAGPKELVSGGVSGLYNRFRQSVGVSSTKENKSLTKSIASKDSGDAGSSQSSLLSHPRTGSGLVPAPLVSDVASLSNTSVVASSVPNGITTELRQQPNDSRPSIPDREDMFLEDMDISAKEYARKDDEPRDDFLQEQEAKGSLDDTRSFLTSDDRSGSAAQALVRVLSQHEAQPERKTLRSRLPAASGNSDSEFPRQLPSVPRIATNIETSVLDVAASKSIVDQQPDPSDPQRPLLLRVGPSHLPGGFQQSRTSSTTDGGELASTSSTHTTTQTPVLDPSPNLNTGLQRRRAAHRSSHPNVPSHLRRRVISKEFWMRDENAKDCFNCGSTFSTFRRKHHCRTCGQIFDAKCTTLVPGRPFGQPGTLRLCKPCESEVFDDNDSDSSDFSEDDEDGERNSPMQSVPEHEPRSHGAIDGSFLRAGTEEVATPSIGIPASRRNREAKRRSAVIEFDAHPALARPSSSHSLISLTRRPRSSSHRRHNSRYQNLRSLRQNADDRVPFHQDSADEHERKPTLPAFHNDNIIDPELGHFLSDEGSDDDDQPNIMSAMDHVGSSNDRDRLGLSGIFSSALKKGRSRLGTTSSSIKGVKEDDIGSPLHKHLPKLRKRTASMGSTASVRPSPRRIKSNNLLKTIEADSFDDRPPSPVPVPSSLSKVVRSAELCGIDAPPVELNAASLEHVRKLLAQLLNDAKIDCAPAWSKALVPTLLQCTDDVEPDVQGGDDMDIRHYVKLKKVPGGRPGDTSYVSGIVFSKNVALKSMATSIRNPRIAIVTFAIEYSRHQQQFMSLAPVISQEKEYLGNLVNRIATLKPNVLLVERHVSGVALQLLNAAGITVVYNIKDSVLAAVSRVTQAPMIKSVDKLAIAHLGHCESFEVKTFMHQGTRKSYIYLAGCRPDLGCTIVLRGGNTTTLRKIKRITEFMCYVVYSLKLETSLMRDEFVSIPSISHDQLVPHDGGGDLKPVLSRSDETNLKEQSDEKHELNETTPSKYETMEQEYRKRILSASPFVVFMQPYLLTQLREHERKLAAYRTLRDQYAAADEEEYDETKDSSCEFELVRPEMVRMPPSKDQPKAIREYLNAVHEAQFEKTMYSYETQKKLWESFMTGAIQPFDPFSHQTIVVLHSSVSTVTSIPCYGPELLAIAFYAGDDGAPDGCEGDCTLGQYIEDMCARATEPCDDCGKRMYEHHRQYVHGYGQLSVSVHHHPSRMRGYSDSIYMWSSCRICRQETSPVRMSDDAWKYSFAKYLELSFWSCPLQPRANLCEHDIHKDYLRCFEYSDMLVRMQYDPIELYDVVVPRSTITWKVETDLKVKNDQFSNFIHRLNKFTDSIKKRLDSIHIEILDEKDAVEATETIKKFRLQVEDDHKDLLQKVQKKYAGSRYYELIPLNRALRFMDEKAIAWDDAFAQFEQDFFPSDNEIRKFAEKQLKSLFDSDAKATRSSDDLSDTEMIAMTGKDHQQQLEISEFQREKAEDVLASTVGEHRASLDDTSPQGEQETLGGGLSKQVSPQEIEQAVEREDVRHLDLAVPSRSPEENMIDEHSGSPSTAIVGQNPGKDEKTVPEPKPLGSGLLERIEQIRNNQGADAELAESKIPRLADLRKREGGATTPPPLIRTQSQPAHVPQRIGDWAEFSIDSIVKGEPEPQPAHIEKRLADRLGVGRLASKVGKVAPSLIPRSIPMKTDEHSSTVSALAKHFEHLSREFEKERLKERRQRIMRSRQGRANPLASSKPVVEVYRNASEAVGEKIDEPFPKDRETRGSEEVPETIAEEASDRVEHTDHARILPVRVTDSPKTYSREPSTSTQERRSNLDEGDVSDTESSLAQSRDATEPSSELSSALVSPTFQEMELHPELSITEQRKNVWFKYLADFWSKRSSSGWSSLEYPLMVTEHVFDDADIIVREDEPSSVIALALACADYQVKVKEFRSHPRNHPHRQHSHSYSQSSNVSLDGDAQQQAIESSLLSDTGTHMKYSFSHGPVKTSCKIFYAEAFDALRRKCHVADRFVESLSRCLKFDSKGGKTKSLFLRTLDSRFIIKSLQEVELKAFTKFAPDYFAFMSYTLFHGVPSVIAKMFGLFQVTIKNPATGVDFSYYLLVMENLFYERNPTRRFDLKGSMRNRKIESTGQPDEVLLDENLVETIFEKPLFVREHARKLLQASVWNDTMWLCKQNVMDYSLMAGFDDERKEIVVGIIDCIRTYTWDKKLESWIKDRGKNKPTITSPKDYRNRFRVSMMQYVLQAPNCWHQFQAQMMPPKTLKERDERDEITEDTDLEKDGKKSM